MSFKNLLKKYDVQVPRYTSYPTVPYWDKTPTESEWTHEINTTLNNKNAEWSLYIHIPFCETLCTFCGCNNIITKNHKDESSYVNLLLKEWALYKTHTPLLLQSNLNHIHLGGGTPTFLSADNLKYLLSHLIADVKITKDDFEASIEVDPRRTTIDQIKTLKDLGFNRISLGVQDFSYEVQRLVNRIQSFEETANITNSARELGYTSINFDLIYGLPAQNLSTMQDCMDKTIELKPDRIALYSFALVPWIKPQQRLFKDSDLPNQELKRSLYDYSRARLIEAGYREIGMDHFALPSDPLTLAANKGRLHRNFMGYTDRKSELLLGLGVSSISESSTMFHQNQKLLPKYLEALEGNHLPTQRGHILSSREMQQRKKILELMTTYKVDLDSETRLAAKDQIDGFLSDGLIKMNNSSLEVTDLGRPFLRNIGTILDDWLKSKPVEGKTFSKSI